MAWEILSNASWLDRNRPLLASAIKSLPWVADEIDEHEQEVVQRLVHFATFFDSAFGSLLDKSWIHDGLDESETAVVEDLYWLADEDQAIALRILDRAWVTDGIEDLEAGAIHWLKNFRDAEVTSSVVDLAWVRDGIEEVEVKAIQQLSYIVHDDAELASSVIGLGWVQDGIEDIEWQAIDWVSNFNGGDVCHFSGCTGMDARRRLMTWRLMLLKSCLTSTMTIRVLHRQSSVLTGYGIGLKS